MVIDNEKCILDKFFVIMTGSASGDENNTPSGACTVAHNFALWAKNTLAAGLDPVIGVFPKNIYVFDYFHYLNDLEHYLKEGYESGYQGGSQDDHPNATACNTISPIFVQEVFNSSLAYEERILPVELSSFSASIIDSKVKLNWRTETEVNNYGFEVERQIHNGQSSIGNFEKIGFANGNGNSNSPKNYSFTDLNPIGGSKFRYRLKQIDNDGQFEYSKTIEVDFNSPKKFELSQNYPNPFNPKTTIRFSVSEGGNVKLTLYNPLGQEIKIMVNEYKESGTHIINFDASDFNSGMYIYKLESGSLIQTRKMILLK